MSEMISCLQALASCEIGILTKNPLGGLPLFTIGLLDVQSVSRLGTKPCYPYLQIRWN